MDNYTEDYANDVDSTSRRSAKVIMDLVMEEYKPKSIVDFGCGKKAFLKSSRLKDAVGVDGHYVHPDVEADLNEPVDLGRRFDLVMSLEVAEHLRPESADTFVETLCRHGDLILFSASVPFGGNPYHLNEQWWEYWIEKFEARGYDCSDWLRDEIWNSPEVAACYKNDILVFSKGQPYKCFEPKVHPEFLGIKVNNFYQKKKF